MNDNENGGDSAADSELERRRALIRQMMADQGEPPDWTRTAKDRAGWLIAQTRRTAPARRD